MKQTYTGACHCGAVRFQASLDLSRGTIRCNCSICRKSRTWLAAVDGADFQLLSGAAQLADYQFARRQIHHHFCKHCGVKVFGRMSDAGKDSVAIVVSCLEGLSDAELAALPITYLDGREDNFRAPPAETRYL